MDEPERSGVKGRDEGGHEADRTGAQNEEGVGFEHGKQSSSKTHTTARGVENLHRDYQRYFFSFTGWIWPLVLHYV